jgi:hypothetical protein
MGLENFFFSWEELESKYAQKGCVNWVGWNFGILIFKCILIEFYMCVT